MSASGEISQLKQLWRSCFCDTEEFIDLFFNRCYTPERCVSISMEGRVVSALYILPRSLTGCRIGERISAGYIFGVGTEPQFRKQGLMHRLFSEAHRRMRAAGIQLSLLIPATESIRKVYGDLGYRTAFWKTYERFIPASPYMMKCNCKILPLTDFSPEVYRLFSYKTRRHPCFLLHDADDFSMNIQDSIDSGGSVLAAFCNGRAAGVAFCMPQEEGKLHVREGVYASPALREELLTEACRRYGKSEALCWMPAGSSGEAQPTGMAYALEPGFDLSRLILQRAYMSLMFDE